MQRSQSISTQEPRTVELLKFNTPVQQGKKQGLKGRGFPGWSLRGPTEELYRKHLVAFCKVGSVASNHLSCLCSNPHHSRPGGSRLSAPLCEIPTPTGSTHTQVFFRATANPLLLDNKPPIPSAILRTHPVVGPWIPGCQQDTLSQYKTTRRLSSGCYEEHRGACPGSLIPTSSVQVLISGCNRCTLENSTLALRTGFAVFI